jgi:putative ubiquitin-RnfH superfamily antitoxin RatB of RatAB toxin-antitoxin module
VLGIYGVPCGPDRPLRDGDRVEIYRPLRTDPRVRRREQVAATPRKGWKRPR